MSGATLLFMILGPIAMLGGGAMMIVAMRSGVGESPKGTALLIAGMMATAFGMLLTAFAIGNANTQTLSRGRGEVVEY